MIGNPNFVKGNQIAKGNKGGGRSGYEIEQAQFKEMQSNFNWLLAYIKAVRQGKNTEKQDKSFIRLEKVLLKFADKLHANKNTIGSDPNNPLVIQIPIYNGLSKHDSDTKNLPAPEENQSSIGRDFSEQDNINPSVVDRLLPDSSEPDLHSSSGVSATPEVGSN